MRNRKILLRSLYTVAVAMLVASTAAAQQPGRISGQIERVDGAILSVKTRDGKLLKVNVDANTRVSALVKASLADIKNDSFIGVAGMPQSDGTIKAFSVHIFLPSQRALCQINTGLGTRGQKAP